MAMMPRLCPMVSLQELSTKSATHLDLEHNVVAAVCKGDGPQRIEDSCGHLQTDRSVQTSLRVLLHTADAWPPFTLCLGQVGAGGPCTLLDAD